MLLATICTDGRLDPSINETKITRVCSSLHPFVNEVEIDIDSTT